MSYATSLQMAYPPPYGPSTLLSDDLVHRTSVVPYYAPSSVPYRTGSHLPSDDFVYHPINVHSSSYRSINYPYLSSITNWQRDMPARISLNNIREYSASLGTASNTASSVAHSINENSARNQFSNYPQSYKRFSSDVDRQLPLSPIWSSRRPNILTYDQHPTSTNRSLPELSTMKLLEEIRNATTSPPPPPPVSTKQENNLQRNATIIIPEKQQKEQPSTVDVHTGLTESRKGSPVDEKAAEQAWTNKVDQLHTTKAQREKEKAKASRALPNLPKKTVQIPPTNETKSRSLNYQRRNPTFFDSVFDGNYYRKTATNQQSSSLSPPRNKSTSSFANKPKATISPKQASPTKVPPYAPPVTTTTTVSKKPGQNQSSTDSLTSRENVPKDTDERFREALHKFRSDRAEQQQRELAESTAKRLNYGNYVRRSTRDGSLPNPIKPSPWADFMDTKKGNVYSLEQEEKKDLYNQSKSYGERVRNRNFALHNGGETTRTSHRSNQYPKESQSDDETSDDDDNSKPLKRSGSGSTIKSTSKTYTKKTMHNDMSSNRSNQSSSSNRATEYDDGDTSDFQSNRKTRKRIYNSSMPTTSATEESDIDQTNGHRHTDDDLFTVREEKTLQSLEGLRSKKR